MNSSTTANADFPNYPPSDQTIYFRECWQDDFMLAVEFATLNALRVFLSKLRTANLDVSASLVVTTGYNKLTTFVYACWTRQTVIFIRAQVVCEVWWQCYP